VPQRPFFGLDLLPLEPSDVDSLLFAISPASPKKTSGLRAGKPSIACQTLGWQNDPNETAMKSLFGVMIDRRTKILKIATRTTIVASKLSVCATIRTRHS
jgi:hypothetical protein